MIAVLCGDGASFLNLVLSYQHQAPAFLLPLLSSCLFLIISPHLSPSCSSLSSGSWSQVELPDLSTSLALPGILRVTAQPGSYQKSATRILFWSLMVQNGITQTLCVLGCPTCKQGKQAKLSRWGGRVDPGGFKGHLDLRQA